MNKKKVSKRVLLMGKPLPLDLFEWDSEKLIFRSSQNHLILDFNNISNVTFNLSDDCILTCASRCDIKAGDDCILDSLSNCEFIVGRDCIIKTWEKSTISAISGCTLSCKEDCNIMPMKDLVLVRPDVLIEDHNCVKHTLVRDKCMFSSVCVPIITLPGGSYNTLDRTNLVLDGVTYWITYSDANKIKKTLQ